LEKKWSEAKARHRRLILLVFMKNTSSILPHKAPIGDNIVLSDFGAWQRQSPLVCGRSQIQLSTPIGD
jgi:hypothetical protein